MPQMAPLMWNFMFLMIIICLIITSSKFYFLFNENKMTSTKEKIKKDYFNMVW